MEKTLRIDMMKTGDLVRKFNGEIGMVFEISDQKIIAYKEGWDTLPAIYGDIMSVARPTEPWMLSPCRWDDSDIWDDCWDNYLVWETKTRTMTRKQLQKTDDVHKALGYTLIIAED